MTEAQGLMVALIVVMFITLPLLCGFAARNGMAAREAEVRRQLEQVRAERFELGRQAHDLRTMINMHAARIEDDTTVKMVLQWEEPA